MAANRQRTTVYVASALTALFVGATAWLELKHGGPELPRYHDLPDFSLTDQDGLRVTPEALRGQVWLADFVYTTCPGPCPMITAHMARIQAKMPEGVRLVSISTDPLNDTPEVLKKYAAKFGATDRWTFLTGVKAQVYDLINHGFLLAVDAPPGAPIVHSTRMVLVDKYGTVRAFYDGTSGEADPQIIADMERLLSE